MYHRYSFDRTLYPDYGRGQYSEYETAVCYITSPAGFFFIIVSS